MVYFCSHEISEKQRYYIYYLRISIRYYIWIITTISKTANTKQDFRCYITNTKFLYHMHMLFSDATFVYLFNN